MSLPRNSMINAVIRELWASGADGRDIVLGALGTIRDIAGEEGGQPEIDALAIAFIHDGYPIRDIDYPMVPSSRAVTSKKARVKG